MKVAVLLVTLLSALAMSQHKPKTYCNPMNLDYGYCPIPNFVENGKHRATADPAMVTFRGDYYLFSTNQWGYWWSSDLNDWHFVAHKFLKPPYDKTSYDELCAPAPFVMNDKLYVIGSTYEKDWPIWISDNPKAGTWSEAVDKFPVGAWDPDFFLDDDGRLYLYHGSSNTFPIYGWEIDPKTLLPVGEHKELIKLNPQEHGWERFGEGLDNTFLDPFIEGAWMTKQGGKYYLQYGAPGTEFSGYGDGVYVSDHPLGPFTYQSHNPFSLKSGGFARGAGHGSTFKDTFGNYWHISTIGIGVKNNFERRNGLWPAGIDAEGTLYCNQNWGDYPTYLPDGPADHQKDRFTGWMLLNYNKPVQVSSTLGGFAANNAVDESIKTYWSAKTGNAGEWIQSDLGSASTVRAVQINFADQDASYMGKQSGIYHRYKLTGSLDGKEWFMIADKSGNKRDVPHDYVELEQPVEARFIRLENVAMPTGRFAISGLRVFGNGHGVKPKQVKNFIALRGKSEPRNAWLKWAHNDDATGYNIYWGVSPDKLYSSVMLYSEVEYYFRFMDAHRDYYMCIEAFNENGVSERTPVIQVEAPK